MSETAAVAVVIACAALLHHALARRRGRVGRGLDARLVELRSMHEGGGR